MLFLRSMLLVSTAAAALTACGQNTSATQTPQTGSAAPAATRGPSGAAQPAGQGSSRRSSAQTTTQGGQRQPATGITGVPRYRAGFRGPQGTPAPAATANTTITGVDDGSRSKQEQSAALPGVPTMRNAPGIPKGTPLHVRLQQAVDSGHARNGDTVQGVLTAPAGTIPAGAPVQLTVVAVASAGQMTSNGELSLQVIRLNGEQVLSEVITAEGKEGTKLTPDGAPDRGTEAIFTPDQPLTVPAA